jgi:hypothetical protein
MSTFTLPKHFDGEPGKDKLYHGVGESNTLKIRAGRDFTKLYFGRKLIGQIYIFKLRMFVFTTPN